MDIHQTNKLESIYGEARRIVANQPHYLERFRDIISGLGLTLDEEREAMRKTAQLLGVNNAPPKCVTTTRRSDSRRS